MKCKRCGSEANNQEVMPPSGPHYGKLVCASCGNFLQWLPWPRKPIDPAKMPSHPQGAPLPALKGASDKQVLFGEKCRAEMLLRVTSLEQSMRDALYAHLQRLHAGFHDDWQSGQPGSRFGGNARLSVCPAAGPSRRHR